MSRLLSFSTIATAAIIVLGTTPGSSHAQHNHPHPKAAQVDSTQKPASADTVADTTKADTIYTCPMDPEVVSKTPARCSKCGMKLVKKVVTKQAPKDSAQTHKGKTHRHAGIPAQSTANTSTSVNNHAHNNSSCCDGCCDNCDECDGCDTDCNDCSNCSTDVTSTS